MKWNKKKPLEKNKINKRLNRLWQGSIQFDISRLNWNSLGFHSGTKQDDIDHPQVNERVNFPNNENRDLNNVVVKT